MSYYNNNFQNNFQNNNYNYFRQGNNANNANYTFNSNNYNNYLMRNPNTQCNGYMNNNRNNYNQTMNNHQIRNNNNLLNFNKANNNYRNSNPVAINYNNIQQGNQFNNEMNNQQNNQFNNNMNAPQNNQYNNNWNYNINNQPNNYCNNNCNYNMNYMNNYNNNVNNQNKNSNNNYINESNQSNNNQYNNNGYQTNVNANKGNLNYIYNYYGSNNNNNNNLTNQNSSNNNKNAVYNIMNNNVPNPNNNNNLNMNTNNQNPIYNNINLPNNQNNLGSNQGNNYQNTNTNDNNQNQFPKINTKNLAPKTTVQNKKFKNVNLDFFIRARGLDNVGATCYMNSTLQCFYHVKELSENLINDNKINKKLKLTFCYKNLIEELTGCKDRKKFHVGRLNYVDDENLKESIKPSEFKDLISDMNPLFKGVQANDSKDLILFLLETMDKELTIKNNGSDKIEQFYGNSAEEMKPENFKKCHNSIFSDIFYGFQKSFVKCLQCGNENPTYSVINFIIFPLERIYNDLNPPKNDNNNYNNNGYMNNYYMNNNMYGMMNNNYNFSNGFNNFRRGMNNSSPLNPQTFQPGQRRNMNININININNNQKQEQKKLTLEECFKHNNKKEDLTGENQIYCNQCQCNTNGQMIDEIHMAPKVLILIINRGKGNVFKCDLDFPKLLDLSKFISNESSPKFYDLIGVISHLGESSMEGHFIAYCKHFDDNWYIFNDSIVRQVNENAMLTGTPYILFYQNRNFN